MVCRCMFLFSKEKKRTGTYIFPLFFLSSPVFFRYKNMRLMPGSHSPLKSSFFLEHFWPIRPFRQNAAELGGRPCYQQ